MAVSRWKPVNEVGESGGEVSPDESGMRVVWKGNDLIFSLPKQGVVEG